MDEDHRVPPLSNKEIREDAAQSRRFYGTDNRRPVNIVRCLESGSILTRKGRRKLIYNTVGDHELRDADGCTEFTIDTVIITVKRSVHDKANWGDGRSRMTLAHELAHGVLHYGKKIGREQMFRLSGAVGTTELSSTNAAESAEHQAKVFASAFLIDDKVAIDLVSKEEISVEFGVALEAARIAFERLEESKERARSAERVRQSNEEYQASMRQSGHGLKYTGDICIVCENATMFITGIKLTCHTCGNVTDFH
jgi:hypothetical protein